MGLIFDEGIEFVCRTWWPAPTTCWVCCGTGVEGAEEGGGVEWAGDEVVVVNCCTGTAWGPAGPGGIPTGTAWGPAGPGGRESKSASVAAGTAWGPAGPGGRESKTASPKLQTREIHVGRVLVDLTDLRLKFLKNVPYYVFSFLGIILELCFWWLSFISYFTMIFWVNTYSKKHVPTC